MKSALEIQTALLAKGFDPKGLDGRWGDNSKAALAAFQKSVGLYPDGVFGAKTEAVLFAPSATPITVTIAPARQSLSKIGFAALLSREAARTTAYLDSKGIWTIGIGHTAAAGGLIPYKGLKITMAEVEALFARDIVQYEDAVRRAVKVPLADHQFDALTSVCYNIGTGGTVKSSFARLINEGAPPAQIRAAILAWKIPPEIIARRMAEANQFETPYNVSLPRGRANDPSPVKVAA
jgi:lysozyme